MLNEAKTSRPRPRPKLRGRSFEAEAEAKASRPRPKLRGRGKASRPRPKIRGRGRGQSFKAEEKLRGRDQSFDAEAEAKILASGSRPLWLWGLNITAYLYLQNNHLYLHCAVAILTCEVGLFQSVICGYNKHKHVYFGEFKTGVIEDGDTIRKQFIYCVLSAQLI